MAEAEEFEESDILFHERADVVVVEDCPDFVEDVDLPGSSSGRELVKLIEENYSDPINIPGSRNVSRNRMFGSDGCGGGTTEEFVPPHVIIGRRVAEKLMALSICTGKGTTIKGRDLSDFRNKILRMTGFLEA